MDRGKSKATKGKAKGKITSSQPRQPEFYHPEMYPHPPPPTYYFPTQQSSFPPPPQYYSMPQMNEGFDAFQSYNYREPEEESNDEEEEEVQETQEDEDEEEEEAVPETQPIPGRRRRERGGGSSGPAPPKQWSPDEEVALAQAYIAISEDPQVGTNQRRSKFWGRVLENFCARMGGSDRTDSQINSKWRDLNGKVSLFAGLYNNNWTNRGSGQSDADVMKVTNEQFKAAKKGKAFSHFQVFEILRGHPRWAPIPLMDLLPPTTPGPAPKRTKTSESNTYTTSSDANFSPNVPNESFQFPERPQRKGKRAASSQSGEHFSYVLDELKAFKEKTSIDVDDKIRHRAAVEELKKERLRMLDEEKKERLRILDEEKKERLRMLQEEKDEAFFLRPHDQLTGSARNMVLAKKARLAEKYGWEFDPSYF